MTDRVRSLTVALENDTRIDDVEAVADAIRMIKGVIAVTANIVNGNDWSTEERVRRQLSQKLYDALK